MSNAMLFNPSKKLTGYTRLRSAAENSFRAIVWLSQNEAAFRQELVWLIATVVAIFIFQFSIIESALLLCAVLLVMVAEIVNTAIETVVDRVGLEIHPLSGRAKDLGSAAVLLTMLIAAIVWIAILIRHI